MVAKTDEQVYSWRDGFVHRGMDPDRVGKEFDKLHDRSGGAVTPDMVVDAARNPKSAMHHYFDWDDTVAADKWRKRQGREILNSLRVKFIGSSEPRTVAVSVRFEDGSRAYRKTEVAVTTRSLWDQVMLETQKDLSGTVKRLKSLVAVEYGTKRKKAARIQALVQDALDSIKP